MSEISRMFCGIILVIVPTVQCGGYFLLQLLSGKYTKWGLTDFQKRMFRAGHAHAGVLIVLALVAEILIDYARLPISLKQLCRYGFALAPLLFSGGFFASATGKQINKPNKWIHLLTFGALILFTVVVMLGIGLIL